MSLQFWLLKILKIPYYIYLWRKHKKEKKLKTMYKFQHINQLRDFIIFIERNKEDLLSKGINNLVLFGTPKLHGTNASIVFYKDGTYQLQSRNNILNEHKDNMGFKEWMNEDRINFIKNYFQSYINLKDVEATIVYGEFAGKGIQQGMAISNMERFFAPFAIRLIMENGDDIYLKPFDTDKNLWSDELRIFNLLNPKHKIMVNINNFNIDKLVEDIDELVKGYETQDLFAKDFGVHGIGEGIVWNYSIDGREYFFKTKIDEFKTKAQKVNKDKSIEQIKEDKMIIEYCLNEQRLKQGIDYMKEMNIGILIQNIQFFIKWVIEDVLREEHIFLENNNVNDKRVSKLIGGAAAQWYKKRVE